MMRLAIFGVLLIGLLAEAAEVTVTNVTEAAQWQRIYQRIRTEMGITNVDEMMRIPLFRAKIVHPAFGIYWHEVPAPTMAGASAMTAVDAFVSSNGWDMQTDGIVFCDILAPDKSKMIRDLPWTEIHDREFPAVTHDGILYVFFTGWHHNNHGVAYNPKTNTFARGMAAFKPIGQHWYVWAMTDDSWKGPQQYEGTNQPNWKPAAVERTDKLAQSITNKPHLAPLQDWAVDKMNRVRSRQLLITGRRCAFYPFSKVQLATNEIAPFILQEWHGEPEVSVVTTTDGQPECVAISWYLHGLFVGATNYVKTIQKQFDNSGGVWYLKQAWPGIYAYHLYK